LHLNIFALLMSFTYKRNTVNSTTRKIVPANCDNPYTYCVCHFFEQEFVDRYKRHDL
jgi:hypothetical protein